MIVSKIWEFLDQNSIIPIEQFGFQRGLSCETCLTKFHYDLSTSLSRNKQVDAIFIDIKDAFKTLKLSVLKHDLEEMCMPALLVFIIDFLSDRSQTVKFKTTYSDSANITQWAPQGTVCAPILFLLLVRKFPNILKLCKIYLFADDCVITLEIRNIFDALNLEFDFSSLNAHIISRGLIVNKSKTVFVSFGKRLVDSSYTIDNVKICRVPELTYLGVIFYENTNFKSHIELLRKTAWAA